MQAQTTTPITIAVIAYDGANAVDVFGPLQVFSTANYILKKQNQFSSVDGMTPAKTDTLLKVQEWINQHLDSTLEVSQLAGMSAMSVRNFSRKFAQETGLPPSRYIAQVRLNKARLMLEGNTDSISRIARVCGYQHSEILRRLFIRELNVSPSEYRKRFHVNP